MTQAIATKETKKTIYDLIQSQKSAVEMALPKHMRPDRMLRVMMTSLRLNPKLEACSAASLLGALMKCSQAGLEPDGRHAHLIPYGSEATLIFDYKGLVSLVRRSGEVSDIHCDVVCENDEFEFSYGTNGKLLHRPNIKSKDRGEVYCAYSYVLLKDGSPSYEVMTTTEINEIRDASQGYRYAKKNGKQTPWDDFYGEMSKKTVFRRHSKWLPLSFELKEQIAEDDDKVSDDRRFAAATPIFSNITALPAPETTQEPVNQEPPQVETKTTPEPPKDSKDPASETKQPEEPKIDDPVKMVEENYAKLTGLLQSAGIHENQFMLWVRLSAFVSPIAKLDEMKTSPKRLAGLLKNWEVKKYAEQIKAAKEAA